jgi:hypothetical protein
MKFLKIPILKEISMNQNFRMYPVADTLPHQLAEDVKVGQYILKKGTIAIGESSLLAIKIK